MAEGIGWAEGAQLSGGAVNVHLVPTEAHGAIPTLFISGYSLDVMHEHNRLPRDTNLPNKSFSVKELVARVQEAMTGEAHRKNDDGKQPRQEDSRSSWTIQRPMLRTGSILKPNNKKRLEASNW
ncbi:MAG: hypothetical protein ACI8X5_003269 [Planctomycetota bacterium]